MRKLKLAELGRVDVATYKQMAKLPLVVVLDDIRSKNNVGSIFRSSDAFQVEKIVLCGYTPVPPDRDIAKTSLGAELSVQWSHEKDVLTACQNLRDQGYQVIAIEQVEGGGNLPAFVPETSGKYAIVLGNEVDGVDERIINTCDAALEIPQFGTKHSLNVSVAAGIVLYDLAMKLNR